MQRNAFFTTLAIALLPLAAWPAEMEPAASPDPLSAAVRHLTEVYGAEYPRGAEFLERLQSAASKDLRDDGGLRGQLEWEALTSHPRLADTPVLFVCRHQYLKDHHNTATLFQTGEINTEKFRPGGPLKSFVIRRGAIAEEVILAPGASGLIRDPEVSFDGKRILFSLRRDIGDDYHIYELEAGKSAPRQLTRARGVADIDPLYLPGGDIVFSSTREPKYCMCNRHIMANLFRMEADGANIHQIGKSTLFEGHSSLMPDGRILYDRWEYVDRNFGDAQGLWVVNPDGAGHALHWGNNTASPGGVIDGRMIPGTSLCLAILANCHDRPWGALAMIDRSRGIDGADPILRTWPASARDQVTTEGTGKWDSFMKLTPKYEDPFPLDSHFFLVSRTIDDERTGIFLVDLFGNELLLHEEKEWGCYDPMPVRPRAEPPARPDSRDLSRKTGRFYVQDIYVGTHMDGIERGEIRYLRVVESPEKRNWVNPQWGGQGRQSPAMNWHSFENKRILGVVPVEEDGSAYFEAPANTFLYFQALDRQGMMVQSMRSGTIIRPGEVQGCVGCHENRIEAPVPAVKPLAMQRGPDRLDGWMGASELFSYMETVQPIWDRHCAACHDFGEPAGEKLVLAGDRTLSFNASYIDLWSRGYLTCAGGGPAAHFGAKTWGSHASRLAQVLREGHPDHRDVKLSEDEMEAVITWIDLNAPYYPTYECAYPENPFGRSPLTSEQAEELSRLTGTKFVDRHGKNQRAQVCFERPEKSLCLSKLDAGSPEYRRAIELIRAGLRKLREVPRADMAGFVPCESDRKRITKYEERSAVEDRVRAAMVRGEKVYDP